MQCLLIFDHLNDIVYTKYDQSFEDHIKNFASNHELLSDINAESSYISNVIVQIFAPIITSHRIMNCQFGNSYTSIQCQDGLNIYFEDYMGYLFVNISNEDMVYAKKFINVAVTICRYLCGPDVELLKMYKDKSALATNLMDSWIYLNKNDQAVFIEAVEQLIVNPDLCSATIKALRESVTTLAQKIDCVKIHALILVQNKFLSLYSSQNAKELSTADILFCTILCHSSSSDHKTQEANSLKLSSYQVLLAGPGHQPKCLPHVIHIIRLSEGVSILYLLELGNPAVAASLYETFTHLHTMQLVQIQREKEILQPAFENLDLAVKRLNDSLKKNKNHTIDSCYKQLLKKWEVIRKKYQEYLKNTSDEALLRAETLALGFLENLKELLNLTYVDETVLVSSRSHVLGVAGIVKGKLAVYDDFFKAKSIRNFSLGSRDSLTIKKYLEEFPGLVHFLYIDRSTHRVTMPGLDDHLQDRNFTRNKIWQMMKFAHNHLQEGNLSLMWKDTTFHYSYFLWFEDANGGPLKHSVFPTSNLPLPGILCEDFYQKLKETCFPRMAPAKIKCYELFCVHLGLVTTSCVLEQTRRLSATIWELRGHPNYPVDIL